MVVIYRFIAAKILMMTVTFFAVIALGVLMRSMSAQIITMHTSTARPDRFNCFHPTTSCVPLPPDYEKTCNASNSFTLSNGRFIDQYKTFCGCRMDRLDWQERVCTIGVGDQTPIWHCNDDGTYNCRTHDLGKPAWCVSNQGVLHGRVENDTCPCTSVECSSIGSICQSACIRYSGELQRFQNVGQCTCNMAPKQQFNDTLPANDNYVPQCSSDRSLQKLQTGYGGNWCVDSSGNPTTVISFDALYSPSC